MHSSALGSPGPTRAWALHKHSHPPETQAAALESFLFARDEAALDRLGAEAAAPVGADDYANVAGLVRDAVLGAVEADEAQGLLIYEDRGGGGSGGRASTAAPAAAAPRRPAWEDPDDVLLEVNVAVRSRLRKLRQVEEEVVLTGEPLGGGEGRAAPGSFSLGGAPQRGAA